MDIAKKRDFLLQESKQVIKEAKIRTKQLNEMAHISGKLQDAIDSVIEAYPELDGLELKRKIRSDVDVIEALDDSELYENQLNKYIALKKGRRELKKRGKKVQPKDGEEPINEMAKIQGSLKDAIDNVISNNPDLSGLPLKKAIRSNEDVISALDGEILHDNQLNRYIAKSSSTVTTKDPLNSLVDDENDVVYSDEDEEIETTDTWNIPDEDDDDLYIEPTVPIDNSFEEDTVLDPTANSYKNIILLKVSKVENPTDDNSYQINLQSLKQYIKRPEVIKALGKDLIKTLISPVIG